MDQAPAPIFYDQPRFALIDEAAETRNGPESPRPTVQDVAPPPFKPSSSPAPLPSTEAPDPAPTTAAAHPPKKKGTASAVKKGPKRTRNGESNRKPKKSKSGPGGRGGDEASGDDESDNGPYCLCRGPDDHRWMICCENCEDWFHGECININKEIGEALIEKFVCPLCTKGNLVTIYKKACALGACRKPARLTHNQPSVFCSSEHAQTWWERMVARLPKAQPKAGLNQQHLSQDELMAILNSDLGSVGEDGTWKVARIPFSGALPKGTGDDGKDDALIRILSDEEKTFLDNASKARFQLAEETVLCDKMLRLVELAQEHRRAAITGGRFGEDICGYDSRLDTISARDAFAAYAASAEGQATFKESKLGGDALSPDEAFKGMCERKRCKVHSGWHKMLPLGIKYQIREMANQAAEWGEEESIVREAASERWKRKQAEKNWVEVVDG
ncbi:PHD-finger domain-containing protein [Hirsutella rhossiliensis]|uniref:PHD-finger domain-containing protein n=1 Tax=Hirsutella rhossiliensis TaxID=111463 RepID=A0A9P8SK83_9HYPO|nr:PHD-finger domain-containing protein [Hirsutella rhossiliensis]KAH0963861.1 PHD-finger domain-containing protein [Hirsutella rhossiliensis]